MNELEKAAERISLLYEKILDNQDWDISELDELLDLSRKDGIEWQAQQSPWISVEERLPPQAEHVLLKKGDYYVGFGFFGEKMIFHSVTIGDNSLVPRTVAFTHWMPIPE